MEFRTVDWNEIVICQQGRELDDSIMVDIQARHF